MRDVIAIDPLPKWNAILTRKSKSPVELFLQTGLSVMSRYLSISCRRVEAGCDATIPRSF
jgi:hypothetical protein